MHKSRVCVSALAVTAAWLPLPALEAQPPILPPVPLKDVNSLADGHGSYGPGQLQVLFDRIFDAFETRSFAFRDRDVTVPSSRTAFARVRWERVSRQDRRPVAETLTFTLRADGDTWRILEIRTSR